MVPVLVLGLAIFDMSLVVISRLRRGISPNTPGKDHTSHRLVDKGLTQREAVLALYLSTGALGMIAVYVTQSSIVEGYVIGGLVALLALYAFWRLDSGYLDSAKQKT
jgi:UDP-GlcNAc:undecaprenyl-phosphate GlcNAc-1-phosphate transferase